MSHKAILEHASDELRRLRGQIAAIEQLVDEVVARMHEADREASKYLAAPQSEAA